MRKAKKGFFHYVTQYRVSNIRAMLRNNRLEPKICHDDFHGKRVAITGATSGIGRATARKYAAKGATLLCINRSQEKSDALCQEIQKDFGVDCSYILADLSCLDDIHRAANKLAELADPIDVLILNAGIFLTKRTLTAEGLDTVFTVHYLSSFIITSKLLDKLKQQDAARIIFVNSEGHRFAPWGLDLDDLHWQRRRYTGLKSYGSAKLAQLLAMRCFRQILEDTGVSINAMHPGAVKSNSGQENGAVYRWLKRNLFDKSLRSADISAEALYYLGVSQDVCDIRGEFFNLTSIEEPAPPARDAAAAEAVWEKTISLLGLVEGA